MKTVALLFSLCSLGVAQSTVQKMEALYATESPKNLVGSYVHIYLLKASYCQASNIVDHLELCHSVGVVYPSLSIESDYPSAKEAYRWTFALLGEHWGSKVGPPTPSSEAEARKWLVVLLHDCLIGHEDERWFRDLKLTGKSLDSIHW